MTTHGNGGLPDASRRRPTPIPRQKVTKALTAAALALTATTALPTPAIASARRAEPQILSKTCDPVNGTRTYYSPGKWSKANAILCVEVQQRADGSKALYVSYDADLFYSWGGVWHSDCQKQCTVSGRFILRKGNGAFEEWSPILEHPEGSGYVFASHTFNVDSRRWRVEAAVTKRGGYWASNENNAAEVPMNDFAIEVDVP
ncbi:hypothetical protein [Nonomuraea sp. NPDC050786]|uniref:hypothetical protein n=1 Tax=Nonomuraea sp. NPDC050786 TaxID=3154840 RepID=UPI0033C3A9BB